jgi:hypothetical protein
MHPSCRICLYILIFILDFYIYRYSYMSHAIYEFELYENDLNRKNSMKVECIFTNDTFIRIGIRSSDKDCKRMSTRDEHRTGRAAVLPPCPVLSCPAGQDGISNLVLSCRTWE